MVAKACFSEAKACFQHGILGVKTHAVPFLGSHFRTYLSGDWDVHLGGTIWILTHGQMPRRFWLNPRFSEGCGAKKLPSMAPWQMAVGQNEWCHCGVGAPPILEPILVGKQNAKAQGLDSAGSGAKKNYLGWHLGKWTRRLKPAVCPEPFFVLSHAQARKAGRHLPHLFLWGDFHVWF